ncbi:flagellar basal body rod protein FlgB [Sulfuriflexus mobilis]|uniref:flagellar basal body rod protein FlgB n=1 Tax=Sulfuriflexus mobilis TaxID=1811807 RepID=UPI000F84C699|nr:flagellar basal body rod protein FlgB [Sulfuriflexus mobilis]
MILSFDNAFGIHPQAIQLYARRSSVLASNLANADTPNYKARDIDFRSALNQAKGDAGRVQATHARHFGMGGSGGDMAAEPAYRTPLQPSLDGNTVDVQVEQAAFADNSMRYMASLRFVTGSVQGLLTALRGE